MGILIGGIGSSHAPSIAHAWDQGHQQRPEWKPFFDAYGPVKQWLADQRVDTVVMFYNDHLNHFQFGNYPTFAMGIAETMPVCDEGDGPRDFPPVPGNVALGWHLASSLVADEFDLTICQEIAGRNRIDPVFFDVLAVELELGQSTTTNLVLKTAGDLKETALTRVGGSTLFDDPVNGLPRESHCRNIVRIRQHIEDIRNLDRTCVDTGANHS